MSQWTESLQPGGVSCGVARTSGSGARCGASGNSSGESMMAKGGVARPKLYYLQNQSAGYIGNSPLWWREGGGGYTANIREAKVWTKEEADAQIRLSRGSHWFAAWPVEDVDAVAYLTVDIQDIGKAAQS